LPADIESRLKERELTRSSAIKGEWKQTRRCAEEGGEGERERGRVVEMTKSKLDKREKTRKERVLLGGVARAPTILGRRHEKKGLLCLHGQCMGNITFNTRCHINHHT
jgi:hypothetical protein